MMQNPKRSGHHLNRKYLAARHEKLQKTDLTPRHRGLKDRRSPAACEDLRARR